MLPGTGTSTLPKFNQFQTSGKIVYSDTICAIGQWQHFAISFDRVRKKMIGFVDGIKTLELDTVGPATLVMYLGGHGDRPASVGANPTRYTYRGLMSNPRFNQAYTSENFNPITW
jgi:hypothetical protein